MSHLLDSISAGAIVAIRDNLMAMQAQGKKVFRLESGDPSFRVPSWVEAAINAALLGEKTHYTESSGILPLREAIVSKVNEENGITIEDASQVMVTSGAMHALFLVFSSLVGEDSKNQIIIPDPMWTEVGENIRLGGGVPVRVRLTEDMKYLAQNIEDAITPNTKAIFVNTPHNPTGTVVSKEELERIVDVAVRYNLYIVADEAYEHILYDGEQHTSIGSLPGAAERTFTIFSTSKSYAMSGLRVGYIVSRIPHVMNRIKKLARCTTNGISSIAQWGAAAAILPPVPPKLGVDYVPSLTMEDYIKAMVSEYTVRRDILYYSLIKSPLVRTILPKGAFFLWLTLTAEGKKKFINGQGLTDFLLTHGVGSSPGVVFGSSNVDNIRLAFSCPTEQVKAASVILNSLLC